MKRPVRRSRMLGWDRNPLRRRIDRVEAGMVAGLILVFLVVAPVLVAVAGEMDPLPRASGSSARK